MNYSDEYSVNDRFYVSDIINLLCISVNENIGCNIH